MRIALALALACAFVAQAVHAARRAQLHAAIAYHAQSANVGWATDRTSSREARVEALRQCAHPKCEVVATVKAGCVALARDAKRHRAEKGVTREEAEAKALRRCGTGCEIAAWTCTR